MMTGAGASPSLPASPLPSELAMRILLPATAQDEEFTRALDRIESCEFVVVPYQLPGRDCCFMTDFWLGASQDGRTWMLAAVPSGIYDHFVPAEAAVAALLDPPKRNDDTIAEILLRIYIAGRNVDRLGTRAIEGVLADVQFPEYPAVERLMPEAPRDWLQLPAELVVRFTLSEGACVMGATFEEYRRDSIDAALRVVCGPRQGGLLISYTLTAREVLPLLEWNVDWPLARRGKEEPTQRGRVQGALPWEDETDQSLLSVYQHLPATGRALAPSYFSKPVVRLRVGGHSREAAIANWHRCARALRRLKPDIPEKAPKWESPEIRHE
jgi:hypothetical protein